MQVKGESHAGTYGRAVLEGLKQPREIWVDDRRIENVASDPAFAGAARGVAAVYDLQHKEADACLMQDPETGEKINVSHMIPCSRQDLARRRAGLENRCLFGRPDGPYA